MSSCTKNFLGLKWKQHDWERQVSNSDLLEAPVTDQWGRRTIEEHVLCHIQYICRNCGEVSDGGECGCDRARGDKCPARLASFADSPEH